VPLLEDEEAGPEGLRFPSAALKKKKTLNSCSMLRLKEHGKENPHNKTKVGVAQLAASTFG
jgi:hypothetical protein